MRASVELSHKVSPEIQHQHDEVTEVGRSDAMPAALGSWETQFRMRSWGWFTIKIQGAQFGRVLQVRDI